MVIILFFYKNLFFQSYLNSSYSGNSQNPTRNLATGSIIFDRSKKFSAQLQHVNSFLDEKIRFIVKNTYLENGDQGRQKLV